MPLVKGTDLPGSSIYLRCGYDGREPEDILRKGSELSADQVRIAIRINNDYPDTLCDGYTNRALIGLVQDSFASLGLHVVIEYLYHDGVVPVEERCALVEDEEYLLVDAQMHRKGSIVLWSYYAGSGGAFYGEFNPILDVHIPCELITPLKTSLRELCDGYGIEFREVEAGDRTPARFLKGRIRRSLSKFLRGAS